MIVRWGGYPLFHFLWRHSAREFRDRDLALQFLGRFRNDAAAMAELRRLVAQRFWETDVSRLTDDQVLGQIAALITSGVLLVGYEWERAWGRAAPEEEEAPAQAAAGPARRERASAEEGSSFGGGHDGLGQARVLRSAAESGTPFCEECQRAAQARAGGSG
ncbi:MAG: hypothetical protein AAB225_07250 [Acidobacteriota bacterium]|mgnify:CR=1 FL=1